MDTAQLSAWFRANKVEVLGVGAAAVAGLALYQRKKSGPGSAGVTAGAAAPGTIPAGAVVGTGGAGTYDSSSYDLYNALQDQIGTLARQNEAARQTGAGGSGTSSAVNPPVASGLLSPTGSGQYIGYGSGGIYEMESDGSLYHLSGPEWSQIVTASGGGLPAGYTTLSGAAPGTDYSHVGNLDKRIKTAAGVTGA